jgi:hypothetical protein
MIGYFQLNHLTARRRAIAAIELAPEGVIVTIKEPARSLDQNARLHAKLSDIADQLTHHGEKLSIDDWKDLLVPAYFVAVGEKPRILPNLDGDGFAMMYRSTAKMSRRQSGELMDFIDAFGSQRGVRWSGAE